MSLTFIENPSPFCNWVIYPNKNKGGIIIGSYPFPKTSHINKLIEEKVSVWVNLVEEKETKKYGDYKKYVKENTLWCRPHFISLPIPDKLVCKDTDLFDFIEEIYNFFSKRYIIYVHCCGGHGRSGLFSCCFLMRYYGWDSEKAIDRHRLLYLTREKRYNTPSPGSIWQINQINRYNPPKKVVVTGDRESANSFRKIIYRALRDLPKESIVIHGASKGIDTIAGEIAKELNFKTIEFPITPRYWEIYGKSCGSFRNRDMLNENPNYVFAFHPDIIHSKGTKDIIIAAHIQGIPVYLYDLKDKIKFEGDFYSADFF